MTKSVNPKQKEIERLFKAAASHEETLLDLDEDDPDMDGILEDLEIVFREIIKLDPKNVEAMTRLGEFFLERGGAEDEALIHLEQALQLDPKNKKLQKLIKNAKEALG